MEYVKVSVQVEVFSSLKTTRIAKTTEKKTLAKTTEKKTLPDYKNSCSNILCLSSVGDGGALRRVDAETQQPPAMWCGFKLLLGRGVLFVIVAAVVITVLSLHHLVQHKVVEPLPIVRQQYSVGVAMRVSKDAQPTTNTPLIVPPNPEKIKSGGTPKKHSTKENKNEKAKEDPLKNNTILLNKWPPKIKYPLMLFNNAGRLGNRLNSYATSLRFQAVHNATTVATTRGTVKRLIEILDPTYLPLPVVEESLLKEAKKGKAFIAVPPNYAKSDFVTHLEPTFKKAEEKFQKNHKPMLYSLGGYPNRMWLLAGHHQVIRAAFRFREDLKQKVASFLEAVRQRRRRQNITFVGFHIRRTDYTRVSKTYYKCALPGPAYYESALNYYRSTLQDPVFVVASDNKSYVRKHLGGNEDVEFSDMKSAAEDMALLGSCSHSVMTVGSYGFWASFFAGGQVVYPLIVNCSVTPFVHPDSLGPLDYDNFKPFDINGGGPV